MILATTTVEDVDRFLDVFGTKGAEKRALHGSKGSTVFRDPTEENRVWALFDWDEAGWASFVSDPEVPPILKEAGHLGKPQAALLARLLRGVRRRTMTNPINRPARVGVITDQTGALSFMGIANANVAKMVIDDINARGGLLGRPVELFIEDSATDDGVAEAVAAKLVERRGRRRRRRRHLQLDAPGHQGTGRRPGGDALPLPRAVRGPGVPPADLLHRSGAGAAGRAVLPVADAARPGRRPSTCRRPTTSGRTR